MEKNNHVNQWDAFLATGFGAGYFPWGPGTAGAFVATLLWLAVRCFVTDQQLWWITLAAIVVFTLVSIRPINRLEKVWGTDPSRVVVDEMVGVWCSLLAVPFSGHWGYVLAAFLLFRLFDIWKPLGVRTMERVPGGWGVMLDDLLAGVYGAIVIMVYRFLM